MGIKDDKMGYKGLRGRMIFIYIHMYNMYEI